MKRSNKLKLFVHGFHSAGTGDSVNRTTNPSQDWAETKTRWMIKLQCNFLGIFTDTWGKGNQSFV